MYYHRSRKYNYLSMIQKIKTQYYSKIYKSQTEGEKEDRSQQRFIMLLD